MGLFSFNKMDKHLLIEIVTQKMPFGNYKDKLICDLPEHYLVWFNRQGFPPGKLGMWMQTMYEIRLNGLTYLLDGIKKSI